MEPENHRAATAAAYDRLAPVWAASTDDNLWNEHLERRMARSLLPDDVRGMRILDAGCASGSHSQWLCERGALVTGIDASPAMVDAARRRCHSLARFDVGDFARPLPYRDSGFDGVLCSLALHYLKDITPTLCEFARVLQPAGWLVLTLDHPSGLYDNRTRPDYFATELMTDRWIKNGVDVQQAFWRRPLEAIVDALARSGFLVESIREARVDEDGLRRFGGAANAIVGVPTFIGFTAVRDPRQTPDARQTRDPRHTPAARQTPDALPTSNASPTLRLRPLRGADEAAFLAGHREMAIEHFRFALGYETPMSWSGYLSELEAQRLGLELDDDRVPATLLAADVAGEIVGRASIRSTLNELLAREGGHIGFGVLPRHRRRGYGTEILRQSLVVARALGVGRVLVTCDGDNTGSAAVIERCAGILDSTVEAAGGLRVRRYWIE